MLQANLSGKVAFVTGASSGLGAHFAKLLASQGASVVVSARRIERLNQLVDEITTNGGQALAVKLDVTDKSSIEAAVASAVEHFGHIDILMNNAGVAEPQPFLKTDSNDWQHTLDTNLTGVFNVAQHVAQHMVDNQIQGAIVNTASILGLRIAYGYGSYCASKAAVVQLTKSMALELIPRGIRVNALCPGFFETEMNSHFFASEKGQSYIKTTPAARVGQLSELDGPVLMLVTSSFVNGIALAVDGGHMVSGL